MNDRFEGNGSYGGKYIDGEFETYIDNLCNLQRSIDKLQAREETNQYDTLRIKQMYAKLYSTKKLIIKRVVAIKTGIAN